MQWKSHLRSVGIERREVPAGHYVSKHQKRADEDRGPSLNEIAAWRGVGCTPLAPMRPTHGGWKY
jgi:hypothetical protein